MFEISPQLEIPRSRGTARQISMVPLIDISLFLLIFFMVAGTVERLEIVPVDPPLARSGKLLDEGHLVVTLGRHDELLMGDELVTFAALPELLKAELAQNPDKVVTLKADAYATAGRAIAVMDQIKLAGGRNLSLVTQSEGGAR